MKYTTVALAGLVAVASAQSALDAFPKCSLNCLIGAVPKECGLTKFDCSCSNDAFVASSVKCIDDACEADDIKKAVAAAVALCSGAGVDITDKLPGAAPAPSSSAPVEETTTSAPAEEETTTVAEETSTTSEAAESTSTEAAEETTTVPVVVAPSNTTTGGAPVETGDESAAGKFAVSGAVAFLAAAVAFLA